MRILGFDQLFRLFLLGSVIALFNALVVHAYGWGAFPSGLAQGIGPFVIYVMGVLCWLWFGTRVAKGVFGGMLGFILLFGLTGPGIADVLAASRLISPRVAAFIVQLQADLQSGRTELALAVTGGFVVLFSMLALMYENRRALQYGHDPA